MASAKRDKKKKKYFKLRKHRIWLPIIMFFVISVMIFFIMLLLMTVFAEASVQSKLTSEYSHIMAVTSVYNTENGQQAALDLMEKENWTYILRDKNGKVLASRGDDTCGEKESLLYMEYNDPDDDEDTVKVVKVPTYTDTERSFLSADSDGDIELEYMKLLRNMAENDELKKALSSDKDNEKSLGQAIETIKIPIWLSVPMGGGDSTLIVKVNVMAQMTDIAAMLVAILAMIIVMAIVMIIIFIHAVSNALYQRKVKKLFFNDISTDGRSWMWFLFNAEHILRKRKWAKTRFAVVDLTFINYRSFCLCHSVEEGDRVLTAIHQMIAKSLGRNEICARNSEGTFDLLLIEDSAQQAEQRIKELILQLEHSDEAHRFAFHAGIYMVEPVENTSGLFPRRKNVDIEEYHNNASNARSALDGREDSGVSLFDSKIMEDQRWRDTVQEQQQKALDNEEFVVYYQPKYDPRTEELRGAEALIRWQSPEFGFVTPYRFIPIFEKNGFITEIDHYMISHVARDQKRWLDQGYKCVPVSVNVSRAHFIESDLAEQIRDLVDSEGAPHSCIEIELTESAFFDDKKAMINTIMKLKAYGFSVSMDDFGSGYSSLNSLKDMPLDVLKLDAEFFRGEAADTERGEIVVSEAIRLAKSLNMKTVAEGVEVREQVDFLAQQECDMIQGYYFAKPMPHDEYEQRMKQ